MIKRGDLRVPARHLQGQRGDGGRQQAFETQGTALLLRECRALVEARIAQQIVTGGRRRCGPVHGWLDRRLWLAGHLRLPEGSTGRDSCPTASPRQARIYLARSAKRWIGSGARSPNREASCMHVIEAARHHNSDQCIPSEVDGKSARRAAASRQEAASGPVGRGKRKTAP